jgi:hypothetical protein
MWRSYNFIGRCALLVFLACISGGCFSIDKSNLVEASEITNHFFQTLKPALLYETYCRREDGPEQSRCEALRVFDNSSHASTKERIFSSDF